MNELRQLHQSLRVSKVQELKDNGFLLVIRDIPRDVAILQSDNKMKACLGQNVSASLPKAYQTAKAASKTLMVKGATKVSEKDFKEFLDLNKIIYAKAERLTSKKDGRVLQRFKMEIKDEANLSHYRYNLQDGGISVPSFSTAVL